MSRKANIFEQQQLVTSIRNMVVTPSEPDLPEKPATQAPSILNALEWNAPEDRPAFPIFSPRMRTEQSALVRTIGQRMREARELCNMSQQTAAEALGYANSSKLAKIENATDTNSVPICLLPKAAKLYDVSADFLFGLTSDWERDGGELEDREAFGYLQAKREEDRKRDEENFGRLAKTLQAVAHAVMDIEPLVELLRRGVARANQDEAFEGLKGGAAIQSAADRLGVSFGTVRMVFKKAKIDFQGWKEAPQIGFSEAVDDMAGMDYVERTLAVRQAAKLYKLPVSVVHQAVQIEVRKRSLVGGKARQLELVGVEG